MKVTPITLGAWNVHTLLDRAGASSTPKRRTVLIARQLELLAIQIAALSETRLAPEGQSTEAGAAGYTFFWSGRTY